MCVSVRVKHPSTKVLVASLLSIRRAFLIAQKEKLIDKETAIDPNSCICRIQTATEGVFPGEASFSVNAASLPDSLFGFR